MKRYVIRHSEHEAYPLVKSGELYWYGTPHDYKITREDAERWKQYIIDMSEDPVLDKELIILEKDI